MIDKEHEVSRVPTVAGLGEIIATRSYDSCGNVNRFAHKNQGKDILEVMASQFSWSRKRYPQMCSQKT